MAQRAIIMALRAVARSAARRVDEDALPCSAACSRCSYTLGRPRLRRLGMSIGAVGLLAVWIVLAAPAPSWAGETPCEAEQEGVYVVVPCTPQTPEEALEEAQWLAEYPEADEEPPPESPQPEESTEGPSPTSSQPTTGPATNTVHRTRTAPHTRSQPRPRHRRHEPNRSRRRRGPGSTDRPSSRG